MQGATQEDLMITKPGEPAITVEHIELAQFIHLLRYSPKIRHVIDAITQKAVLILGRFTNTRKKVLEGIREEFRLRGYLPILFDFKGSEKRDLTETVSTLAHLAAFIVVDITAPKSVPQELGHIVRSLPSVPVLPLISYRARPYALFEHIQRFPWVLSVQQYKNAEDLKKNFHKLVLDPIGGYLGTDMGSE